MKKKKNDSGPPGQKKGEPGKENVEDQDENEMFIKRLAIQRKLLKNFVDPAVTQSTRISGDETGSINH